MKVLAAAFMMALLFSALAVTVIFGLGQGATSSWTYGGTDSDVANSMVETSDGGYMIAGVTGSLDAEDYYLVKTDASGNLLWNQTYGGTDSDSAHSMVETSDGGYAIAGYTKSYGAGSDDFYLVKTARDPSPTSSPTSLYTPTPSTAPTPEPNATATSSTTPTATPSQEPEKTNQPEIVVGVAIIGTVFGAGAGLLIYRIKRK